MERWVGIVVSVGLIAATALPVVRDPTRGDSFPLSTYPMFAAKKSTRMSFEYGIAWFADGSRREVEPGHVSNGEVMQARMSFQTAVRRRTLPALCARIAERVAADPDFAGAVRIELVRGTHDALAYLVGGVRGPEKRLHQCEVPR